MEALNLSGGEARDAVNGDWDDNHAEKVSGNSSYSIDSSGAKIENATTGSSTAVKSIAGGDKAPTLGVGYMHIHVISAFKAKVKDGCLFRASVGECQWVPESRHRG